MIRQMLRGWPTNQLFWWNCLAEGDERFGQKVGQHFCCPIPRRLIPHRRFTRFKSAMLDRLWAPLASAHFSRTIRQVQPDVIWAIPHNWSILPLASVLRKIHIRFHVSIQDYVDVHGQSEKYGRARCRRMAAAADTLYALAETRDAISHPMIDDLRRRTGADAAQVLRAGLEEHDFKFLQSKAADDSSEIRIAYAGTILASETFALFVKALSKARSLLRSPVSLHFFGSHSYASWQWFNSGWMHEHGNLPEEKLLTALRQCTWGFAPMELTDHDPRYNRFSFPTKFISYLAAGLPVITLAHPESAAAKMASKYKVGLFSCSNDASSLSGQLADALNNPNPSLSYRSELIQCARAEFDGEKMRRELWNCFAHSV